MSLTGSLVMQDVMILCMYDMIYGCILCDWMYGLYANPCVIQDSMDKVMHVI